MNDHSRNPFTRRKFITTSGSVLGAAGIASLTSPSPSGGAEFPANRIRIAPGDVVLFQGDSITDAGRNKESEKASAPNSQPALGNGYAWLTAAELLVDRPDDGLKFYNRGISGHKVFQLAERWQADCLGLLPDLLSILIGVNDFWHTLEPKIGYQGTVEIYERDFRALLKHTREALPKVKLVVCEPFVLRCGAVNEKWFPEFDRYRAAARRVAKDFRAAFVPFQEMFDQAVKYAPPGHWAGDGVHPSPAGAALMAHRWRAAVTGGR